MNLRTTASSGPGNLRPAAWVRAVSVEDEEEDEEEEEDDAEREAREAREAHDHASEELQNRSHFGQNQYVEEKNPTGGRDFNRIGMITMVEADGSVEVTWKPSDEEENNISTTNLNEIDVVYT